MNDPLPVEGENDMVSLTAEKRISKRKKGGRAGECLISSSVAASRAPVLSAASSASVAENIAFVTNGQQNDYVIVTEMKKRHILTRSNAKAIEKKLPPACEVVTVTPDAASAEVRVKNDSVSPSSLSLSDDSHGRPIGESNKIVKSPLKCHRDWARWPRSLTLLLLLLVFMPFMAITKNESFKAVTAITQSSLVRLLLHMGANAEVKNVEGETLLLEACRKGNLEATNLFLLSGSNIEATNRVGETALVGALRDDHVRIVMSLLQYGADVEVRDKNGEKLLVQAVRDGRFFNTKRLVEAGAKLDIQSKQGETLLDIAFQNNELNIARLLLDSGANVDAVSGDESLLSRAVLNNDVDKVELLLSAGANTDAVSSDGITTPLFQAVYFGNQRIVELLLAKNAFTETQDEGKWTPLLMSVDKGYKEIVELLIASGANINAATEVDGKTCLMWAIVKGFEPIAKVLLIAGADKTVISKAGNNALAIARQFGRKNIEKLLLEGVSSSTDIEMSNEF